MTPTKLRLGRVGSLRDAYATCGLVTERVFGAIKTRMKLETLHSIQIERFRQMTPIKKRDVALGLLRTARETRCAVLRERNPELTDAEVEWALAKELSGART